MNTEQQLKTAGLKITVPRVRILEMLRGARARHMSAEDVYRALMTTGDDIGLATVYRVLAQFEESGLVRRHNFDENCAVYELNEDEHHDHLVCVECGHVEEFCDPVIEERQQNIAAAARFDMQEHSLIIYGNCEKCQ